MYNTTHKIIVFISQYQLKEFTKNCFQLLEIKSIPPGILYVYIFA